jgi:hypothetical protein
VTIGDLTFATAGTNTLRVYTSGDVTVAGRVIGDTKSSIVLGAASTQFDVTDSVLAKERAAFTAGGVALNLRDAAYTPNTIRVTGSIGTPTPARETTVTGAITPFELVSLNASRVLIFPADDTALAPRGGFEAAVGAAAGSGGALQIDPANLETYRGQARVQITADTLALRASGNILQRNLDPNRTNGSGLIAGRLLVDRLATQSAESVVGVPARFSVFGQLAAGQTGLTSGVALVDGPSAATLVQDVVTAFPGVRFNAPAGRYRINGCEIGTGGGCVTVRVDPRLPPIDAVTDIRALLDRFATVDDEPVTNTGVELNWFSRDEDEEEEE